MKRSETFAVVFFLFFTACSAIFQLSSYDLWWHLAGGRFISEGHGVPHVDPFSHTAEGMEWIDHEWLFEVIVHTTHQIGGANALIFLRCALLTLIVFLVFHFVRRQTGLTAATTGFLLIPFVLAGRDRFLMRPELFTILFATLLLTTLYASRDKPLSWRHTWWIPPLFALWANIHGGLIVGVVLLGLWLGARLIDNFPIIGRQDDGTDVATALGLFAAAVVAGLANPFTYRVYLVPFELTSLIASGVYDNLEWHRPMLGTQWLFYVMVAVSLISMLSQIRHRRWAPLLQLLFLALISLQYARNIALFSLLAPIILVAMLKEPQPDRDIISNIKPAFAVVVFAALGLYLLFGNYRFASGLGIATGRAPQGGVDFIEKYQPPGNLYNVYGFGGYVSWRLWPEVKTFIDGRNEVFVEVRKRLKEAVSDSRKWQRLIDDYDIGYALVSYAKIYDEVTLVNPIGGAPSIENWPYTVTHFPRSNWALVHFDDDSMLYLRRSETSQTLIDIHEIKHVFPSFPDFQIEAFRKGWADPSLCVEELRATLRQDPGCTRAQNLLKRIFEEYEPE